MPGKYAIVRDPEATGPRDGAEYATFRAAHAALPHPELRRIADHRRAAVILARYHAGPAAEAAERDLTKARENAKNAKTDELRAAAAKAIAAAEQRRDAAHEAANVPVPELAPCPVDRCPGHAVLAVADLRRAARAARPIDRSPKAEARRRAARAA